MRFLFLLDLIMQNFWILQNLVVPTASSTWELKSQADAHEKTPL